MLSTFHGVDVLEDNANENGEFKEVHPKILADYNKFIYLAMDFSNEQKNGIKYCFTGFWR